MIDLYTAPTPNGHKVSCTLEALEIEYNAILVNLRDGDQHKPNFLKISLDAPLNSEVLINEKYIGYSIKVDEQIINEYEKNYKERNGMCYKYFSSSSSRYWWRYFLVRGSLILLYSNYLYF